MAKVVVGLVLSSEVRSGIPGLVCRGVRGQERGPQLGVLKRPMYLFHRALVCGARGIPGAP
jgi:hypothetical protein